MHLFPSLRWGLLGLLLLLLLDVSAQRRRSQPPAVVDTTNYNARFGGLQWRNIGPFRGGRSNAVSGVPGQPLRYYMGSTGGGVWQTDDAGSNWRNISDGYFRTGSIGAIAVAPSDPNVIYVGTGEHAVRGVMTSAGDGLYRSTDGGQTWTHLGLPQSRHIAEIEVHPTDPDRVYVAVQGAVHGPSTERGVYRSSDGGQTWKRILYVDENTGAADLSLDPSNPRVLYAGMWDHRRTPWEVRSGGPGSGLYKSTDGGDKWTKLTTGLPDKLGKVAIDVSPAQPQRVYANIEAADAAGGVYRSDDGGQSWQQVSKDRVTVARAWYYIEVFADPQNAEVVYVLNAPMLKSIDGGRTFRSVPNPHGDQHDLWINPQNPQNMILANDGGACITFDGGSAWSSQQNQPTAQFYRVITDRQFPYHLYGGQQDNSTVDIVSQTNGSDIDEKDWKATAGGESAFLAFDPDNPRYVYGGSYLGNISVYDNETDTEKDIMAYPVMGLASIPRAAKYRFNWNAPIVADPFAPTTIYHAGNVIFRSTDRGQSWTTISPDLTRNDTTKQGPGGTPFTNEGAGGEAYNTISYLAASPLAQGQLWAGTDDGRLHLTRDGGQTWQEVTPPGIGEALINAIDASAHAAGTAYVAVTKYKFNDFTPLAYRTTDYGQSWQRITTGLQPEAFVRVVREDPRVPGLLYAGTERGLYISFDRGDHWHDFQLNLPLTPVLDLTFGRNDLVAATSGRAFWILDDLSAVQQLANRQPNQLTLVQPQPTYRYTLSVADEAPANSGQNAPGGISIDYFLPAELPDSVDLQLDILDERGKVVRTYNSAAPKEKQAGPKPTLLPLRPGVNRLQWDLRRNALSGIEGLSLTGDLRGGLVAPGTYTLRLGAGGDTVQTTAQLLPSPGLEVNSADYLAQATLTQQVEEWITDIHSNIDRLRQVRAQLIAKETVLRKMDGTEALADSAKALNKRLQDWEEGLIQSRQKTFQDIINYENRLTAELLNLRSRVDGLVPAPTAGARARLADLGAEWQQHRTALTQLLGPDLAVFVQQYQAQGLPVLLVPEE